MAGRQAGLAVEQSALCVLVTRAISNSEGRSFLPLDMGAMSHFLCFAMLQVVPPGRAGLSRGAQAAMGKLLQGHRKELA